MDFEQNNWSSSCYRRKLEELRTDTKWDRLDVLLVGLKVKESHILETFHPFIHTSVEMMLEEENIFIYSSEINSQELHIHSLIIHHLHITSPTTGVATYAVVLLLYFL
jgi:hypothetical protein